MTTGSARNDRATLFPRRASKFFGRDDELASVRDAFMRTPVATIVGFGGVGKTRMALRYAELQGGDFTDGIAFIECDRYDTEETLARAILGQITPDATTGDALPTLVARAQTANVLVILDGAERYLAITASVAAAIAAGNPSVRLLSTSREALKITGEQRITLAGLPDATAVELFADRALLGNVRFALSDANRERVASICRRLDGIALSIELAASWTSVMSLDALAARLDDRYRLLARGGRRDAPERHQSLKAVVDGSYEALSAGQQLLFRRLAVFGSTFTLDAILGVCADDHRDEWTIVDDLAVLVDKSLVVSEHVGDATQYRLLHTLREYGAALLRDAGEHDALIERLDRWCLARAGDPDVAALLPNIEEFRRAVTRALADPERVDDAATLLAMPRGLWYAAADWHFVRTHLVDLANGDNRLADEVRGKLWLAVAAYGEVCRQSTDEESAALEKARTLLANASDAKIQTKILHAMARVRMRSGDFDAAHALALQCIDLSRAQADRHQEGASLRLLAYERFFQKDYVAAESAMLGAIEAFHDGKAVAFESSAFISLAEIQFACGKPDAAIATIELAKSSPTPLQHYYLGNLAIYMLAVGREADARATATAAIDVCRSIKEHSLVLDGMLALAASCAGEEPTASAQLLGYVDAERRSWKRRNGPTELFAFEKGKHNAENGIGGDAFDRNFTLGGELRVDQVNALIARLRNLAPAPTVRPVEIGAPADDAQPPFELSTLSAREWTIATRVAAGMSNAEIAQELVLSKRTVETHVATILRKANLRGRVKLAALVSARRAHDTPVGGSPQAPPTGMSRRAGTARGAHPTLDQVDARERLRSASSAANSSRRP
jgi:non-specific serine/threonine protein kinase